MMERRRAQKYASIRAGSDFSRLCRLAGFIALIAILTGCLTPTSERLQGSRYRPNYENRDPVKWMALLARPTDSEANNGSNTNSSVSAETNVIVRTVTATNGVENSEAKRLRTGMSVKISLLGITPPAEIRDVIDSRGEVTLPYIGKVKVEGLTTDEAESLIEQMYIEGDIYRRINVIVICEEERQFFIRGEVKSEGRYLLKGEMTLLKAITAAGGYTEYADRRKVRITRDTQILVFDCEKIDKGKAEDPVIKENDIIVVPRRFM